MQRLNAEGHDESQYLPHGTPSVNPFRAQHRGIRWEGNSIRVFSWLPDILLDRELIERDHLNTCLSINRAVISTLNGLGLQNVRAYLTEVVAAQTICQCPDKAKCRCEKDIFFNLISKLNRKKSYSCMWIVTNGMRDESKELSWTEALRLVAITEREIGFIKEALESAQKIIDDCKKSDNI